MRRSWCEVGRARHQFGPHFFARPILLAYPNDCPSARSKNRPLLILLGLMVASLAGLCCCRRSARSELSPFADQTHFARCPNFWNVISNFRSLRSGRRAWQFHRDPATFVIFLGIFLTGFGSAYYHWNPSDGTLFWGRLPITLCFMAILAVMVEERMSARQEPSCSGRFSPSPSSACYCGAGPAMQLYGLGGIFSVPGIVAAVVLFPPKYTGTFYWIIPGELYALAKLFEFDDRAVHSAFHPQRTYAQASLRRRRLLCDPEIFPDPPADRLTAVVFEKKTGIANEAAGTAVAAASRVHSLASTGRASGVLVPSAGFESRGGRPASPRIAARRGGGI